MRWQGRAGSGNVEDRRGMGMALPVGGGIGGLVLLLLISALTGTNPIDIINSGPPPSESVGTGGDSVESDPQAQFISVVLKDTEDIWNQIFRERGADYQEPVLVLFTNATQSACGVGQSAMGPFYCPADQKVYLDLSFFHDLDTRFGASGDFAQAYVVAHEVGHHVQTLTGVSERVNAARSRVSEREANQLSVRQELQAGRACSTRAMRKKGCAPPRRLATTACRGSRRDGSCPNRSLTDRRRSGSPGCGAGWTTVGWRRATHLEAVRSDVRVSSGQLVRIE
jgi:predicted metalloprotease